MLWVLRNNVRRFRRAPLTSIAIVLVFACCIAINATLYSIINACLFVPPAATDARQLRYIYSERHQAGIEYSQFLRLATLTDLFSGLAAVQGTSARLNVDGVMSSATGEAVSTTYFNVLGLIPETGRFFTEADDRVGAERVVVISHGLWMRRFGGKDVIGTRVSLLRPTIPLSDQWGSYTIVGVSGPEAKGLLSSWTAAEFWVPITQRASDYRYPAARKQKGSPVPRPSMLLARLVRDVSDAAVAARMRSLPDLLDASREKTPSRSRGLVVLTSRVLPLPFDPTGDIVPAAIVATASTLGLLVFALGLSSLVGLVAADSVRRKRDNVTRAALGASRWHLIADSLHAVLLLSAASWLCGLVIAKGLLHWIRTQASSEFVLSAASAFAPQVDGKSVSVALGITVVGVAVLSWSATRDLSRLALRDLGAGTASTPPTAETRGRRWLVICQVSLATLFVGLAGTVVQPLVRYSSARGYDPGGVVFARIDVPEDESGVAQDTPQGRFRYERTQAELAQLPGTVASAAAAWLPTVSHSVRVVSRDGVRSGEILFAAGHHVSSGYLETLNIPVTVGRSFAREDRFGKQMVAIVSRRLAHLMWPNETGIGRQIAIVPNDTTKDRDWLTVIGVADDIAWPSAAAPTPTVFLSMDQDADPRPSVLLLRGRGPERDLTRNLTAFLAGQALTLDSVGSLDREIAAMLYPRTVATMVSLVAGLFGILLATSAAHSLVTTTASQRTRELAIRHMLGGQRRVLALVVLKETATAVCYGSLVGSLLTLAAIRLMARWGLAISFDPISFATAIIIVGLATASASYRPVRRACDASPLQVLRDN